MKWSFLLFSSFLCLQAIAQYPATGNKMRLGWQTTGDGLVYRGAIGDTATLDPSGINNAWMLLDTANGNLYAYRAKAWRLVSGGGGGGGLTMPFDSVTFNVNETDASERELQYSEEKGYLQYGGLDSVQIPLLPGIWYVRNDTSVTIPKGTVVRATGTLGASGRIKVKHMIANGSIDAMYILGIAMQDIAVGADGYVMTQGKIRNVNTQAYSEGAVLYADVDTLGGLTQTEPTGSNLKLPIAFVVHSASNGTLAVRVSPGTYLRDLHDAYITSPVSNASLYYNASESVWRDTTAAVLTSDTAVFARDFQISGTANRLAMFTGSNTVGNSWFSQSDSVMTLNDTKKMQLYGRNGRRNYLEIFRNGTNTMQTNYVLATDTAYTASTGTTSRIYTHAVDNQNADYMISTYSGGGTGGFILLDALRTGIGTTTPAHRLDVNGDVNTTGMYKKSGTDIISGTTNYIPKFTGANTIGNSVLFDNGTSIGLGTTSPLSTPAGTGLTLGTTSSGRSLYMVSSADGSNGLIQFKDQTGADALQIGGTSTSNWLYGYGSRPLRFFTNATEVMRIEAPLTGLGNVGIHTSSPSRPLHVNANTSMIIPSGTTGTRPASGADGDIRFNSTVGIKNLEWYNGAAWREPVNAARSPAAALANRFSKFDANGLLDTSAVLVQSNGRIGIWNSSPAASDSVLTVTGGIRTTTSIRTGSDATINGIRVGRGGGNNANSIAIGVNALATGSNANIAIGSNALQKNTTGYWNVALGFNALQENTDQANLIAIGVNALQLNTSGYYNVSVGSFSLSKNTSGNNNVAFGGQALENNTDGTYNAALGTQALQSNTSGAYNIAIGSEALKGNLSAQYNAAIGTQAMFANTTGANNFALGAFAFRNNIDGANNTIIGNEAGRYHTGGSNVTKLDNSILIGYDARPSATSGNTGEVVIGYQGRGNGSNTTTIGNSSTTKTFFQYGETYIGTATDNGAYNLQVAGGSYLSGEIKYVNRPAAAAVTNVGVDANGVLREATSSQRFKDNITPYQKGLSDAMRLQAKTYTYKGDTTLQAGFIAEDVHEAGLTEYVNYDKEGRPYSLQYGNMVTLLLNAMKEQQAQIEALKKEIEALKNK